ncbi:Fis family transcriptional regulator [candidate division WOR-3 bacterium RBG_13_43_14]|uniref:Fis family transcriptional regulator n=1 Tax=candidate division WOR-3 bacterium RBG_13_43_14 TaxID=1802590 RepID=A0A1F4U761_UNCW3|nr:MAG: Fis family transcriptional regulator [candidate division WOR-3 bacterium RBG_13_43_14]
MADSILIIDDEVLTLNNLKKALGKEGYEVLLADSGETGIAAFKKHRPNLVLADLMLPGIDGIEVLKQIKTIDTDTVVIMITAYEILERAVESMKLGAYDYLLKPFKLSELKASITRALELQSLRIRVSETVASEKGKYFFDRITAKNRRMIEILRSAKKVAALDKTTVLITGASGAGKGLIARAIHYNSPRVEEQFIEINCAAIPENLLESELFGYEPGAFTDARRRKIGLFEKADHGTIFLDEIADMPLPLQAKVLKVVEEQSFTRLGGTTQIKIDVRIITASNKNLKRNVENGEFREDLYYRLNVIPINIPPLRERKEDILPLILAFTNELNRELHKSYKGITEDAAKVLIEYDWPGNVRELKNIIERIMALNDAEEITIDHLPLEIKTQMKPTAPEIIQEIAKQDQFISLHELEKKYIKQVLKYTGGNKTIAAKVLGIHPTSLFRKLKAME